MKIEIDTQRDTEEHIRHAIRLLMSLIGEKEVFTNEVPTSSPEPVQGNMMDMFGAPANEEPEAPQETGTQAPDFGAEEAACDQSGFSKYGSQEAYPEVKPEKESPPPGSLFGIFKDKAIRENKIIPY